MRNFAKNNIYLVIGFLVLFVLLLSNLKSFFKSILVFFKDATGNQVNYSNLDDSRSTMSLTKAKTIAEGLYVSMFNFGTDEERIFELLKDVNQHDYAKIYNAFGFRYYQEQFGTWSDSIIGVKLDLTGWLENELNSKEMSHLKSITNGVF